MLGATVMHRYSGPSTGGLGDQLRVGRAREGMAKNISKFGNCVEGETMSEIRNIRRQGFY